MLHLNLTMNTIDIGENDSIPYDLTPLRDKHKVDLVRKDKDGWRVLFYSQDATEEDEVTDFSDFEAVITDPKVAPTVQKLLLSARISAHIYKYYSRDKQAYDRGSQAYSQSVIVGLTANTDSPVTLDSLTVEIMGAVLQIEAGQLDIDTYISNKAEELQEHYKKLLKIGIRLAWAKKCIDEAKAAAGEGREPEYPEYPL